LKTFDGHSEKVNMGNQCCRNPSVGGPVDIVILPPVPAGCVERVTRHSNGKIKKRWFEKSRGKQKHGVCQHFDDQERLLKHYEFNNGKGTGEWITFDTHRGQAPRTAGAVKSRTGFVIGDSLDVSTAMSTWKERQDQQEQAWKTLSKLF
jgi:antitoxin component YwqK of YwqJK toxin-antitoxin module